MLPPVITTLYQSHCTILQKLEDRVSHASNYKGMFGDIFARFIADTDVISSSFLSCKEKNILHLSNLSLYFYSRANCFNIIKNTLGNFLMLFFRLKNPVGLVQNLENFSELVFLFLSLYVVKFLLII